MPLRLVVDLYIVIAEAAFLVGQRTVDQCFQVFDGERFELENLRPRNERAVDVEKRIVRRRADESEVSAFDVGQENVLLRFVEMMDLVDEQNCFLTGGSNPICRRRERA